MLKQSLVQEKISELNLLNNPNRDSEEKLRPSTTKTTPTQTTAATLVELRRNANNQTPTNYVLPHIPQWPRLQIGTYSAQIFRTAVKSNTNGNLELVESPVASNTKINKNSGMDQEHRPTPLDFDGVETLNSYTGRSQLKQHGLGRGHNVAFNSSGNNSGGRDNSIQGGRIERTGPGDPNSLLANSGQSAEEVAARNNEIAYENTQKLKYLEKSIRFIQQQHNETLNGLHQEIEKLKIENRELHFKLATRRLSASSTSKLDSLGQMEKSISVDQRERPPVENKLENEVFRDADEKLRFEKILKTLGRKEPNLDHRLDELKYMYELNKYDELLTRLKDAESKNEYLAKVIAQLEARRDGDQKMTHSSLGKQSASGAEANLSLSNGTTLSTGMAGGLARLTIDHIHSLEPLRIRTSEHEEPRAPTNEESEMLVRSLCNMYKQQRQQISNMKLVLKNVMQTEKLSNQALLITKHVLEHPPLHNNKISNFSARQYHSQILNAITNRSDASGTSAIMATTTSNVNAGGFNPANQNINNNISPNSSLNISSVVHLPPLQNANHTRFPERVKRTQLLQKQRLKREFFY